MEESLPWPANATPTALVSPEQGHELTEDGGPKTSLRRIPARRAASSSLLSKLLSPTYEAEELEQERESATTRPTPVQVARSTDNFQNLQRGNGIVNSQHDHDRMTDTMAQTMRPLYASSQSLGDSPSSTASRFNITDMNLNHVNSLLMSHREFLQSSRLRGISLERTSKEKVMHSLPSETQSSNPGDTGLPNPPATAEDTSTTISSQPPTDGYRAQYRSWRDTHPGTLSEKAWSISEQGSGQDSDGQVEMSIAEALARVEPNTRSRKASHSLRFFKEGLPDEKFKKRDGKDCLRLKDKSSGIKTSATLGSGHVSTTTKAAGGISPGQRSATSTSGAHRDSSFDHQPENPSLHDSSGSVAPVGSDGTPDNQETSQQSENGPEKSGQAPKSLPTQLLDDLRKMHNLTPAAEKGSSFSKSLPLIDSERPAKSDVEVEAKEEVTEESVAEVSPTKERPDEDEEESSEEQISSALFVPHQSSRESRESAEHTGLRTHAPEDICDGERRGSSNEPEQWLVQHEIHPRESENKSPMIPSSARMSPTTSQPPSRTPSIYFPDVLSSTPESSYIRRPSDAGYSTRDEESSHTDDPEITPTEKSRSRAYMAKNHKELQSHEQTAKPPLEAIELIPYKHQVGGHTTMWRFSKRAVCKQLNNRENEFYETIEHFHPALLKFMPRYIGVLNVTFEKQLKRRTTTKGESESTVNGGGDVTAPQATDGTEAQTKPGSDSQSSLGPRPQSAGRSRVISQSLDVTQVPTPTVTFADNRHIIPKSFLQQQLQQQIPNIDRYRSLSDSGSVTDPGCRRLNQSQPTIPSKETMFRPALSDKHVASWGATTVNRKLRYEVFGEAFLQQPIPIQRHKKPAHQHRSLPHRQANANTLRTSNSETSLPEAAQRAQDEFTPKAESAEESMRMRAIKGSAERNGFRPSSADSPQKERAQLAIPKREASLPSDGTEANFEEHAGTSAPEADLLMETPKSKRKRRYSSGGLRRKPEEVADDRGSLKYFEEADDAGYAGDGEDDVFKMDSDPSTTPKSMPAATTKDSTVHSSASANPPHLYPSKSEPELTNEMVPAGRDVPVEEIPVLNRPVNPKEAQTQRDSRVEYFLLLEDLTAGMKRPCIMDLKMGTRQYGVDANTKKQLSQRRKCASTTSKELGVRVCGLQVWDVASQSYIFQDKYFGRDLKAGREFQDALTRFLYDGVDYSSVLRHIPTIIHKLSQLEVLIRHLKDYRFYAASLLLFYDGAYDDEGAITTDASTTNPKPPRGRDIDFKIADFANCVTAENGPVRDKPCPPQHLGEPDRGFLRGLRTLKTYFLNIQREVMEKERMVGAGAAQELQALDALDAQHTEDEGDVSY